MNRLRLRMPLILFSIAILLVVCRGSGQAQDAAPAAAPQAKAPTLVAKFSSMLNTKSAKAGDPITAKTVQDLKLNDLDIPKGSKLVGTVATVQSKQAGNGNSTLAIKFDHVELKGGSILRIAGLITAIGQIKDSDGLGANSVLSRGGAGSTPGTDASMEVGHAVNRDDIPPGSSMEDVALGIRLNSEGASELHGVHRDIRLDSDVMIKVALFRGA